MTGGLQIIEKAKFVQQQFALSEECGKLVASDYTAYTNKHILSCLKAQTKKISGAVVEMLGGIQGHTETANDFELAYSMETDYKYGSLMME